jgi:hypothetical protein
LGKNLIAAQVNVAWDELWDGVVCFGTYCGNGSGENGCEFGEHSGAKDLSLPKFEIDISHKTFDVKSSSYATGQRTNSCHVTMEEVDNTD